MVTWSAEQHGALRVQLYRKPGRSEPVPSDGPRQNRDHQASSCSAGCIEPSVQSDESVTEALDYVPARFRVIRHVRPRLVCRSCEQIRQAPAVDLPLPKVMASSALLANLVVSRFVDHQPWHRQSVIFRRVGLHIDRDVMSRWARKLAWLLAPLGERLFAYIREAAKIHGDDTPVTLLGNGDVSRTGHFW
ncbi:hypothetical protein DAH81_24970 [Sphingomonas koreensis]|nr:hypothetical protein DAH81_24970 [Sphingomonas koreensis]